jgi:PAS domain S-box/PAS domain S-box/PAS domain S-box
MPHPRAYPSPAPAQELPFPPHLTEVMADLSCVLFRRELLPGGDIRYPFLSSNVRDIFGFEAGEMTVTSKGALNAIHWADRDAHVAAILRSGFAMTRCQESFRAVTAKGETRWFRGSSVPVKLEDGRVVWDGAWLDISAWMRAEHQFQTVMDHAEDAILTLDANSGIDWANAAAERLFGWTLSELTGRNLAHLMADLGAALPQECGMAEIIQNFPRGTQEITGRRKDGTTFPFELTVSEVRSDGRLSLIVIGRDITRRKATELMLEETERRLRSIASNLPGVVFQRELGPDGVFAYSYVSEGIEEILGCEAADIVFDSSILFDAMEASDRARLLDQLLLSADTLEPVDEDVRVTGADGRTRWLAGQSRPRRRGDTIVWDGLILDVTDEVEERNKAEQAVRESEERFRLAFASSLQGIVIASLDGRIQQFNPAFQVICSHTGENLIGKNIRDFIDSDLLPSAERPPAPGDSFGFEYQSHLADGRLRHWRVIGTSFATAQGAEASQSLLLSIEDITERMQSAEERRQLELALTEGQKLEALGRLAGGVAHELNNMLGPILMGAEMVTRTARLDDKNAERIGRIIEAARHGRDIVRNVLAYCRKEQKTLAPVDIVPVFTQFCALAASILPPTVKVEAHIGPDAAVTVGDAGQITQILLNLVNNARDAMEGQGTLGLSLDVVPGDGLNAVRPCRPQASGGRAELLPAPFAKLDHTLSFVDIRIADTGCGMTAQTAAKIFDPFFTTKPVDQGTGLGLSVVQGIIKAMGGAVSVESAPGLGAVFRIVLPLVDGSNA